MEALARPMPVADTPPITVARLQSKIAELDRQRQQHMANAHACSGAIQALQALVVDLEEASHA